MKPSGGATFTGIASVWPSCDCQTQSTFAESLKWNPNEYAFCFIMEISSVSKSWSCQLRSACTDCILGKTALLAQLGGSEAKEGRMWHQAELQRGKKMPVLCAFFLRPCWGGCWLKSCSPESQDRPLSVPWSSSVHAHKHTRAILNACWLHCLFNIVTHFSHVPQFWNHLSGNMFYKNYLQFYCTQLMFLQWRFG